MSKQDNSHVKELVHDLVLHVMKWMVVTVCAFIYWMFVLLLGSIFLMNIWRTSLEQLLVYGAGLTIITSVIYACMLIYRKFK